MLHNAYSYLQMTQKETKNVLGLSGILTTFLQDVNNRQHQMGVLEKKVSDQTINPEHAMKKIMRVTCPCKE